MNPTEQASAIADAERAAQNRPDDFGAFEALGNAYFEAKRLNDALSAYQKAVALNPHAGSAYNGIGHVYYHFNQHQKSAAAYEQGIAQDPKSVWCFYGLGILYATKVGDFDRAIDAFERGLAANPGHPFLTASLGTTYARMGQIEKAIEILEQAAKLDPGMEFAQGWLALLYLNLKRYDRSEAACRRQLDLDENADSHRLLGYIYMLQGRSSQAITELERSVSRDPRDYEARAALAKAYLSAGNLPAGEHHTNLAAELAAQDDEYGQACFQAVSGNVDLALALIETAQTKGQVQPGWVRIDPEFVFIQDDPRFQALII